MRTPLPKKEYEISNYVIHKLPHKVESIRRVLEFDPTELYSRIDHKINKFKRHAGLSMDDVFPYIDGLCACGCRGITEKYKYTNGYKKYFSNDCEYFASDVLSIINNYFGKPAQYINYYSGHKCSECCKKHDLELDHVIGVKQGGGGCWLSNYRWLCKPCHRNKTNKDFGFKNTNQIKLL